MLPQRSKRGRPRGRGTKVRGGKRERVRKIDKTKGSVIVRTKVGHSQRPKPTVSRFGVRPVRSSRAPPIYQVEPSRKDTGKEPETNLSGITDKNRRTGEFPPQSDYEGSEDDPEELRKFKPIALNLTLYSYKDMVRLASVEITETAKDNKPIKNSVNDPKLGPYDPLAVCKNCNETDCPGHYGIINFPEDYPVPNPILLDKISRVLSCVCNSCGGLLLPKETLESQKISLLKGYERFNAVTNICHNVSCPRRKKSKTKSGEKEKGKERGKKKLETGIKKVCSANPEFFPGHSTTNGWIAYRMSKKDKDVSIMDPKKVFDILDTISDDDARLLGFNAPSSHPRDMVLRGLLVIPTSARPPYVQGATTRCDQLTDIYNRIIRSKEKLQSYENAGGKCECYKEMIAAVRELMIGNNSKKYQNRPIMPLSSRLQGKNGIFRRFLMGKRTDHCARTVLGPAADIRFGQIRVPKLIANRLVLPIRVFQYNKHAVKEMVRQGKVMYIIDRNGRMVKYRENNEYKIEIGEIVWRKLQEGDVIPFNRQPTLHKYSLMAYDMVIGKQMTIGLHLAVTPPHNADFDGDEGNLWPFMSLMSIAEGKYIMHVKHNLISESTNRPVVGLILDTVTALYKLTYFNPLFTPEEFWSFASHITTTEDLPTLTRRAIKHGVHPYSGRALVSALFPKDFFYKRDEVQIIDGILVRGVIKGKHLGTAHRSILQDMRKDPRYGTERAVNFLTDAPFLGTAWLDEYGFSVGITDCAPESEACMKQVEQQKEIGRKQYETIINEPVKSKAEEEYKEKQIVASLLSMGGVKLEYSEDNAVRIMAKEIGGGAKGSPSNVMQMGGMVGQQFILGERPQLQLTGKQRTLCTFSPGETSMESRGCVLHSFSEGLKMSEFFFHAMSSRQGLMDTAVKTSEIGSIHHKMVKAVEGVTVAYDGSVRDHLGKIIQFSYGNDGFSASELVSVSTNTTQNLATFIDLKMTAARLNIARGWAPRKTSRTILQSRRKLLIEMYKNRLE